MALDEFIDVGKPGFLGQRAIRCEVLFDAVHGYGESIDVGEDRCGDSVRMLKERDGDRVSAHRAQEMFPDANHCPSGGIEHIRLIAIVFRFGLRFGVPRVFAMPAVAVELGRSICGADRRCRLPACGRYEPDVMVDG